MSDRCARCGKPMYDSIFQYCPECKILMQLEKQNEAEENRRREEAERRAYIASLPCCKYCGQHYEPSSTDYFEYCSMKCAVEALGHIGAEEYQKYQQAILVCKKQEKFIDANVDFLKYYLVKADYRDLTQELYHGKSYSEDYFKLINKHYGRLKKKIKELEPFIEIEKKLKTSEFKIAIRRRYDEKKINQIHYLLHQEFKADEFQGDYRQYLDFLNRIYEETSSIHENLLEKQNSVRFEINQCRTAFNKYDNENKAEMGCCLIVSGIVFIVSLFVVLNFDSTAFRIDKHITLPWVFALIIFGIIFCVLCTKYLIKKHKYQEICKNPLYQKQLEYWKKCILPSVESFNYFNEEKVRAFCEELKQMSYTPQSNQTSESQNMIPQTSILCEILERTPSSSADISQQQKQSNSTQDLIYYKQQSIWITCLLHLLLPGMGYSYLGQKKKAFLLLGMQIVSFKIPWAMYIIVPVIILSWVDLILLIIKLKNGKGVKQWDFFPKTEKNDEPNSQTEHEKSENISKNKSSTTTHTENQTSFVPEEHDVIQTKTDTKSEISESTVSNNSVKLAPPRNNKVIICCPHCNGKCEAQKEWAGMKANCPHCGKEFTINFS